MATYRSYDELFNGILTSYSNAAKVETINVGDDLYIRATGLAVAIWGLYKEALWVENQIFEDSASKANIARHAASYSLFLRDAESYDSLLTRLQARKRRPPAGGNKYDFQTWALAVSLNGERVDRAVCVPNGKGIGTILVLVYNSDSSQPSDALIVAIRTALMDQAPVSPREFYVERPTELLVDVSIKMTNGDVSTARTNIISYGESFSPGQTLKTSFLSVFCIQAGADDVEILSPSANVVPGAYDKITINSVVFS